MRKLKKGFTIIELVIVIAVIAVLTAVLVPTFVHLSKKARDTNDKSIVTSANIQLAAQEGLQGKNRSMSEAVKDVDEIGFHMSTVTLSGDNYIVWDSETDRFVLFNKDNEVLLSDKPVSSNEKLFYAVSSAEDTRLKARGFGIYAKSDYTGFSFTRGVSFDTGDLEEAKGVAVSYTLEDTDTSTVHVATNSVKSSLTVTAAGADFSHSGLCGEILINKVASDTFTEFGKVGFVEVNEGHFVADQGANVKAAYATSANAKIDVQNGGVIVKGYGDNESYSNANSKGNVVLEYNTAKDSIKTDAVNELDHEINPPQEVVVEVNNSNLLGVFTPEHTQYILVEDVSSDILPITIPTNCTVNLNMNGHSITTNKGVAEFDYFFNQSNSEFIKNVSCLSVLGTLTLTGEGSVGGPKGWFGIYNDGTLVLDGPSVHGGNVYFSDTGVTVSFGAVSNNGTLEAEGYVSSSGGNVYSRP